MLDDNQQKVGLLVINSVLYDPNITESLLADEQCEANRVAVHLHAKAHEGHQEVVCNGKSLPLSFNGKYKYFTII